MTQEEKLEEAKRLYETANADQKYILERLFPDLKESEDEIIRKALIDYFDDANKADVNPLQNYGIHTDKIIAWLEKQNKQKPATWSKKDDEMLDSIIVEVSYIGEFPDYPTKEESELYDECLAKVEWLKSIKDRYLENKEQKLVDKIEPKFKVGDWVVFNGFTLYVKEVFLGFYRTITRDGIANSYDWNIDNIARLWTIQDAKNGDVLVSKSNQPFIYNGNMDSLAIGSHGGVLFDGTRFICGSDDCNWTESRFIRPATKEQCDLLFSKMKEAGYKLDKNFNVIKI